MSDIQRYDVSEVEPGIADTPNGAFVLYDDHLAALAAVERERDELKRECKTLISKVIKYAGIVGRLVLERDELKVALATVREECAKMAMETLPPRDGPYVLYKHGWSDAQVYIAAAIRAGENQKGEQP